MPADDRVRSDVWTWFEKLPKKKNRVKCKICTKGIAYSGGTTNLREHLVAKHPLQYKGQPSSSKSSPKQQGTLLSFTRPTRCSEPRAKEITDRISYMITADTRPIQMVEGEGFCRLITYLEPGYTIPSRKQFSTIILHKHVLGKEKLRLKLKEEAVGVSLTTDIWTSTAVEAYMTVTVHYIDPNWVMQAFVLETFSFPERHTAVNIAEKLKELGNRTIQLIIIT